MLILVVMAFVKITPRDEALEERKLLALQQSIEIVRRRIDETGVREPTIQRQGTDRILVQLLGSMIQIESRHC